MVADSCAHSAWLASFLSLCLLMSSAVCEVSPGHVVTFGDPAFVPSTSYSEPHEVGLGLALAVATEVATGEAHSVIATKDGMYTMGRNRVGQLGVNDAVDRSTPTRIMVDEILNAAAVDALHVAAGEAFSVACGDFGILTWGDNSRGQLGTNDYITRLTPTSVRNVATWDNRNFVSVSAGSAFASVVEGSTGSVYSWGDNRKGQLGTGDTLARATATVVLGVSNAEQVVTSDSAMMALGGGKMYGMGNNDWGQLCLEDDFNRVTATLISTGVLATVTVSQVAMGVAHTMVLDDTGAIYVCGADGRGQLALDRPAPRGVSKVDPLPAMNLVGVSGLARRLRNHNTDVRYTATLITPMPVGTTATNIAAAGYHSMAISDTGSIVGWGDNTHGQLGTAATNAPMIPTQAPLPVSWTTTAVSTSTYVTHAIVTLPAQPLSQLSVQSSDCAIDARAYYTFSFSSPVAAPQDTKIILQFPSTGQQSLFSGIPLTASFNNGATATATATGGGAQQLVITLTLLSNVDSNGIVVTVGPINNGPMAPSDVFTVSMVDSAARPLAGATSAKGSPIVERISAVSITAETPVTSKASWYVWEFTVRNGIPAGGNIVVTLPSTHELPRSLPAAPILGGPGLNGATVGDYSVSEKTITVTLGPTQPTLDNGVVTLTIVGIVNSATNVREGYTVATTDALGRCVNAAISVNGPELSEVAATTHDGSTPRPRYGHSKITSYGLFLIVLFVIMPIAMGIGYFAWSRRPASTLPATGAVPTLPATIDDSTKSNVQMQAQPKAGTDSTSAV